MALNKSFLKYRIHIVIWVLMLAYLFIAPEVFGQSKLKYGKPVFLDIQLPQPSNQVLGTVDQIEIKFIDGQKMNMAWGWSFLKSNNDLNYERYLVLNSGSRVYYYLLTPSERPDVQEAFKDMKLDVLNSGFMVDISMDAIRGGKYRVGFLYRNASTGDVIYYQVPSKVIIRTPNQLKLDVVQ